MLNRSHSSLLATIAKIESLYNMPKTFRYPWQTQFSSLSPLFHPVRPVVKEIEAYSQWPTLNDLQTMLFETQEDIYTEHQAKICLVPQDEKPSRFEQHYAPRIYLKGEIQTREQNWHDLFQAITWRMFPRSKVAINSLHYTAALQRNQQGSEQGKRSQLENLLSQFDECGVVIISSSPKLLDMIRDFQWKNLFWEHRQACQQQMRCIVFGHAIYEKAINPYVGLTAKALLLECEASVLDANSSNQLEYIDECLKQHILAFNETSSPQDLNPFPILGYPDFSPENSDESYYANTSYFRPKRLSPS